MNFNIRSLHFVTYKMQKWLFPRFINLKISCTDFFIKLIKHIIDYFSIQKICFILLNEVILKIWEKAIFENLLHIKCKNGLFPKIIK